jgi:hypothetical protein
MYAMIQSEYFFIFRCLEASEHCGGCKSTYSGEQVNWSLKTLLTPEVEIIYQSADSAGTDQIMNTAAVAN